MDDSTTSPATSPAATSAAPSATAVTGAWAAGLATLTPDGRVLDSWYPAPALATADDLGSRAAGLGAASPGTVQPGPAAVSELLGVDVTPACGQDSRRRVERVAVVTFVADLADPPVDTHDTYLRLHLLSHRLVPPHGVNLDGLFGLLNNVVWTTAGPCAVEEFEAVRLALLAGGTPVQVLGVDKFPRMTDYVVPAGVRIADADRVRLGAHLAAGTTVMHEGYVNFNAGTLGTAMIEGRLSAGVVVGDGSDIGGGASIMGTLSGGGTHVVSVGERSLLGANAGIGISLGDDCVVEAGLYVTAGTRVTLPDGTVAKALELSGVDGLLFIRNSTTGVVEVRSRAGRTVALNTTLHHND